MRPSPARADLAAAAPLAAFAAFSFVAALVGGAGATVVTTCRAAADSDGRVDYGFCVAELGAHRESPSADTWGLAKVAALTGVVNADDAVYDIKALLAADAPAPARQPGGGGGAREAALRRCQELYDGMGFAFAEAHDDINGRDYAAGKAKAGEAASLAHQCDDAFAKAGVGPSPVAQRGEYAVKIAVVCTAITNLIE